jgi:hypothetical protein
VRLTPVGVLRMSHTTASCFGYTFQKSIVLPRYDLGRVIRLDVATTVFAQLCR